ncbi:Dynein heavy chain, cytoplasmic, partial [Gryllus bimaculatus]
KGRCVADKKMITFLDDLNMPVKEIYGAQPPLELIRQWIGYGFWYDRKKQVRKYVKEMILMAAMGPPGGGRTVITDRLMTCFNIINITFPSEGQILRIFGTMLTQQLADFESEAKYVGPKITQATLDIYNAVIANMLPTPDKIHYLFNLRDISKVFQGLLRSNNKQQYTKEQMLRLWIHECFRVFYDRLINAKDQEWFLGALSAQLGLQFELTFNGVCPEKESPVFVDFMNPFAIYEDIQDIPKLRQHLEHQMGEYNESPGVVPIDLVLFKDAILHICRIVRVISQPRGNMLVVGMGGSGRQSLSRIAGYLCEYRNFSIEVTKSYRVQEFKDDLKDLYNKAGVELKPMAFIFSDTQVTEEAFMEIINNMLSSGEVPNLYKPEEFEEIKNKLSNAVAKAGLMQTTEAVFSFFIERVRSNLHIVLCMSPIGEAFRVRVRQYPGLVNCTTIDWFHEWPVEALLEVAEKYLIDINFLAEINESEATTAEREGRLEYQDAQRLLRTSVAKIFATVHHSVSDCSNEMRRQMKRHNYVTPVNYLELVVGYKSMLAEKRHSVKLSADKLRNGLFKIDETRAKVQVMSVELLDAQKQVAEFQQQCDDVLVKITQQKHEADVTQKEVSASKIKILEEEAVCKKLAAVAQADLDQAMPALEEAMRALDSLNKRDMTEVKSYGRPPPKVEMVMEAVMILKQADPTWAEAKRQLGQTNFLDQLREFDKDNISEKTLKKIAVYTANPEFEPEKVGIVTAALRLKQKLLAEAEAKLKELTDLLAKLEKEYEEKQLQKEELRKKAELLMAKLQRARALVDGLSGERSRWEATILSLEAEYRGLPGDCLMATAFLSYTGPFLTLYREKLLAKWKATVSIGPRRASAALPCRSCNAALAWDANGLQVNEFEIPTTEEFSAAKFLTDQTTIREWNIQGLPSDDFSTENGIIVTRCSRWPLLIDPQCQGMKWIKNMEADNDLAVIDLGQADFMKVLEHSIQYGKPVLLQNILEALDPSLTPILNKAVVKQGGQNLIKLSDKFVEYNFDFRLFITTKMSNPHYPPEICTKTTLVNFAVKEQAAGNCCEEREASAGGAQGETSAQHRCWPPHSDGNGGPAAKGYRPCAKRASILFFVLNDMSLIDPMYQFSLDVYIDLFVLSIAKSKKSDDLEERIGLLNNHHTYAVYTNTCRGLFERHKMLFSFHMCIKILEGMNKVNKTEYNFLLKGGWLSDTAWDNITELDKIAGFHGVVNTFEEHPTEWREWYIDKQPEELPLIGEWEDICTEFQKMLFVRSLRPDRISFCVSAFIVNNLGQPFVEPPVLDIKAVFDDSNPKTPLIFVLSPGVDPTGNLLQLAETLGMSDRFQSLSLGQGQAPIATKFVFERFACYEIQ